MKRVFCTARLITFLLVSAILLASFCLSETETTDRQELAVGANLRVMSFNIMHPDWSRIPVKGRDEIVRDILLYYMPDVVAVQEAGAKWHKALIPLLVDNGFYAQACRKSNADGFTYCTTTFLYNPVTLKLSEEYILDLNYKDATRVFSVAVFVRLSDGARFAVANTHPAPRDEQQKYTRNMSDITAFTADLIAEYTDIPVIVMGDFNTPEQTEEYLSFMTETGMRDAKYEAEVLVRNCSTFFGYQVTPNTDEHDLCVDHIFVNDKISVKLFNAVIDHDVQNASDHIPVYADISFCTQVSRRQERP